VVRARRVLSREMRRSPRFVQGDGTKGREGLHGRRRQSATIYCTRTARLDGPDWHGHIFSFPPSSRFRCLSLWFAFAMAWAAGSLSAPVSAATKAAKCRLVHLHGFDR
jgi:hypothetical protein